MFQINILLIDLKKKKNIMYFYNKYSYYKTQPSGASGRRLGCGIIEEFI
ncbi:hypothetical protein [Caloramator quimbayensis]|nr:hypothetical protein [Caloramator quimbayensis]